MYMFWPQTYSDPSASASWGLRAGVVVYTATRALFDLGVLLGQILWPHTHTQPSLGLPPERNKGKESNRQHFTLI